MKVLRSLHSLAAAAVALSIPSGSFAQIPAPAGGLSHGDFVDIVGPDGLAYPDFTYAGVPGGIPDLPVVASLADHGGVGTDELDDRAAFVAGVAAVVAAGGGTLFVPAGTYYLDSTVAITASDVVIRGAGRDQTRIILRDSPQTSGVGAFNFSGLGLASVATYVPTAEVPRGGMTIQIAPSHPFQAGDFFQLRILQRPDFYEEKYQLYSEAPGSFYYQGLHQIAAVDGGTLTLTKPLREDLVEPAKLVPSAGGSAQPNVTLRRFTLRSNVGVENLTIETSKNMLTDGVRFNNVQRFWLRGVDIIMAGRFPFNASNSMYGEVRDCVFNDSWNKGPNGQGYVTWSEVFDCLMEDVTTYGLRHAPNIQQFAFGNVVRNSTFNDINAEWHFNWSLENLYENITTNIYEAPWSSLISSAGLTSLEHEPIGPRNVVYNSDFTALRRQVNGMVFGGVNRGWIFAHNRVRLLGGHASNDVYAVVVNDHTENVTVLNNHFAIEGAGPLDGGVYLNAGYAPGGRAYDPDVPPTHSNLRFIDNRFYGLPADQVFVGFGEPEVMRDNVALAYQDPPRPTPPVPSILDWQRQVKYNPGVAPVVIGAVPTRAVVMNRPITLRAVATGEAPFTYQWYRNGQPISGATSATLAIASFQMEDAGDYSVTVTNTHGTATSQTGTLSFTLGQVPQVKRAPVDQRVAVGANVTFSAEIEGTTPLTYQWERDGAVIPGATAASYSITGAQPAQHAGLYRLRITNQAGETLTEPVRLAFVGYGPAVIVSQPPDTVAVAGTTATLGVTADGVPPLSYQWYRGQIPIVGATSATLTLGDVRPIDSGTFTVVVSNAEGTVTSDPARLDVHPPVSVYLPFDYSQGTNLVAADLPAGWQSPARSSGATQQVVGDSLGYSVAGQTLLTSGGKLQHFNGGLFLDFDTSPDGPFAGYLNAAGDIGRKGTTLYLSWLVSNVELVAGENNFYGIQFNVEGDSDAFRQFHLGTFQGSNNWEFHNPGRINLQVPVTPQPTLMVVKIEFRPGTSDRATIWVNPTGLAEESGGGLAQTTGNFSFDRMRIAKFTARTEPMYIDEFRVSSTWRGVVPVSAPPPVPSSLRTVPLSTGMRLFWESSAGSWVAHRVERRLQSDGDWEVVGDAPGGTRSFLDQTAVAGVRYEYRVTAVDGAFTSSPVSTAGALRANAFMKNLSTRGRVDVGERLLIGGFVIRGEANKEVLIRAVGPALQTYQVPDALVDPELMLFSGAEPVAANSKWGQQAAAPTIAAKAAEVGAFEFAAGSSDAALLQSLPSGAYTAQISTPGESGVGLVEVYDADGPGDVGAELINISTRGHIGGGADVLIGGFFIGGDGPKTVLIRGVGPALAAFGVTGLLADPVVELRRQGEETILASSATWDEGAETLPRAAAMAAVGAFALPARGADAALLVELEPGAYTVILRGANNGTGVGLIEIYSVN